MDAPALPTDGLPPADYYPRPTPPSAPPAGLRRVATNFLLGLVAGGGLGALIGAVEWQWLLRHAPARPSAGAVALFALLSLWPNILVHEAGHALAGVARGMRPLAFGVGRWRWERGTDRWRVRNGGPIAGIGGFAALVPAGEKGLSRLDQAAYLFGGPAANLMTSALALWAIPALPDSPVVVSLALGVAAGAFGMALLNLTPLHSRGWRSDGRGLLDLLRGTPDAAAHARAARLVALMMGGIRPRDWPHEWVPTDALARAAGPMTGLNAAMLRLSWAMDRNDTSSASTCAGILRDRIHEAPKAFQPHVAVAMAGFAIRVQGDPALLKAWRPLCDGGMLDLSLVREWLDVELAAADGRVPAGSSIAAVRDGLARAPDPVTALLLGEYLDDLERRLSARDVKVA